MQLNFIQSNWHRQYPFKAEHGELDLYNNHMATDLIVALRITCAVSDLEIYISKVFANNRTVSISFNGANGPLGFANGIINTSNQSLIITNFSGGVIGNVTIGNIDSTKDNKNYIFDATNGLVEPSTVLVMPAPAVTNLNIKNTLVTGNIALTSKTLGVTADSTVNLSTLFPATITSRNDKSAKVLTCDNPVISGINSVKPNKDGNIDIFAIAPLSIVVESVDGIDQLRLDSPGIGLDKLCKLFNIPPTDATQTSHAPIGSITQPEWASWPQYNK